MKGEGQFVIKESVSVSMEGSFISQRATKYNIAVGIEAREGLSSSNDLSVKESAKGQTPGLANVSKESARDEQGLDDENLCSICFSEPASTVLLDCGHGGICLTCAIDSMKKNNHCLFCREKVVQIIEIDVRDLGNGLYKVVNSYYVSDGKSGN